MVSVVALVLQKECEVWISLPTGASRSDACPQVVVVLGAQEAIAWEVGSQPVRRVTVWGKRAFLCVPRAPGDVAAPATLLEAVWPEKGALPKPYPNAEMQTAGNCFALQSVVAVEADLSRGRLWVLDAGGQGCEPKLLIFDLFSNKEVVRCELTGVPSRWLSVLVVDSVGTAGPRAYIGDSGRGGLLVFSLREQRWWQLDLRDDGAPVTAWDLALSRREALLYITSPDTDLLFALNIVELRSKTPPPVYDSRPETETAPAQRLGSKLGLSAGLAVDHRSGLHYFLLRDATVVRWDTRRPLTAEAHTVAFHSTELLPATAHLFVCPQRQVWAVVSIENKHPLPDSTDDLVFSRNVRHVGSSEEQSQTIDATNATNSVHAMDKMISDSEGEPPYLDTTLPTKNLVSTAANRVRRNSHATNAAGLIMPETRTAVDNSDGVSPSTKTTVTLPKQETMIGSPDTIKNIGKSQSPYSDVTTMPTHIMKVKSRKAKSTPREVHSSNAMYAKLLTNYSNITNTSAKESYSTNTTDTALPKYNTQTVSGVYERLLANRTNVESEATKTFVQESHSTNITADSFPSHGLDVFGTDNTNYRDESYNVNGKLSIDNIDVLNMTNDFYGMEPQDVKRSDNAFSKNSIDSANMDTKSSTWNLHSNNTINATTLINNTYVVSTDSNIKRTIGPINTTHMVGAVNNYEEESHSTNISGTTLSINNIDVVRPAIHNSTEESYSINTTLSKNTNVNSPSSRSINAINIDVTVLPTNNIGVVRTATDSSEGEPNPTYTTETMLYSSSEDVGSTVTNNSNDNSNTIDESFSTNSTTVTNNSNGKSSSISTTGTTSLTNGAYIISKSTNSYKGGPHYTNKTYKTLPINSTEEVNTTTTSSPGESQVLKRLPTNSIDVLSIVKNSNEDELQLSKRIDRELPKITVDLVNMNNNNSSVESQNTTTTENALLTNSISNRSGENTTSISDTALTTNSVDSASTVINSSTGKLYSTNTTDSRSPSNNKYVVNTDTGYNKVKSNYMDISNAKLSTDVTDAPNISTYSTTLKPHAINVTMNETNAVNMVTYNSTWESKSTNISATTLPTDSIDLVSMNSKNSTEESYSINSILTINNKNVTTVNTNNFTEESLITNTSLPVSNLNILRTIIPSSTGEFHSINTTETALSTSNLDTVNVAADSYTGKSHSNSATGTPLGTNNMDVAIAVTGSSIEEFNHTSTAYTTVPINYTDVTTMVANTSREELLSTNTPYTTLPTRSTDKVSTSTTNSERKTKPQKSFRNSNSNDILEMNLEEVQVAKRRYRALSKSSRDVMSTPKNSYPEESLSTDTKDKTLPNTSLESINGSSTNSVEKTHSTNETVSTNMRDIESSGTNNSIGESYFVATNYSLPSNNVNVSSTVTTSYTDKNNINNIITDHSSLISTVKNTNEEKLHSTNTGNKTLPTDGTAMGSMPINSYSVESHSSSNRTDTSYLTRGINVENTDTKRYTEELYSINTTNTILLRNSSEPGETSYNSSEGESHSINTTDTSLPRINNVINSTVANSSEGESDSINTTDTPLPLIDTAMVANSSEGESVSINTTDTPLPRINIVIHNTVTNSSECESDSTNTTESKLSKRKIHIVGSHTNNSIETSHSTIITLPINDIGILSLDTNHYGEEMEDAKRPGRALPKSSLSVARKATKSVKVKPHYTSSTDQSFSVNTVLPENTADVVTMDTWELHSSNAPETTLSTNNVDTTYTVFHNFTEKPFSTDIDNIDQVSTNTNNQEEKSPSPDVISANVPRADINSSTEKSRPIYTEFTNNIDVMKTVTESSTWESQYDNPTDIPLPAGNADVFSVVTKRSVEQSRSTSTDLPSIIMSNNNYEDKLPLTDTSYSEFSATDTSTVSNYSEGESQSDPAESIDVEDTVTISYGGKLTSMEPSDKTLPTGCTHISMSTNITNAVTMPISNNTLESHSSNTTDIPMPTNNVSVTAMPTISNTMESDYINTTGTSMPTNNTNVVEMPNNISTLESHASNTTEPTLLTNNVDMMSTNATNCTGKAQPANRQLSTNSIDPLDLSPDGYEGDSQTMERPGRALPKCSLNTVKVAPDKQEEELRSADTKDRKMLAHDTDLLSSAANISMGTSQHARIALTSTQPSTKARNILVKMNDFGPQYVKTFGKRSNPSTLVKVNMPSWRKLNSGNRATRQNVGKEPMINTLKYLTMSPKSNAWTVHCVLIQKYPPYFPINNFIIS